MVDGRPDWTISRQRTWGVPIALFTHRQTGEIHPRSVELMQQVADRVEAEGIDVWYSLDAAELLGAEAADYEKVTDILDVWFDSGVTHEGVLAARGFGKPADLYRKVPTSTAAGSSPRCLPAWRSTSAPRTSSA